MGTSRQEPGVSGGALSGLLPPVENERAEVMRHVQARLPLAHPSLTKPLATARAGLDRARSSATLGESNPPFPQVDRATEALRQADQNGELRPGAASLAPPPRDGASDEPRGGRPGAARVPRPGLYRAGKANVVARTEGPSAPPGPGETVQRDPVGNPRGETHPEEARFGGQDPGWWELIRPSPDPWLVGSHL